MKNYGILALFLLTSVNTYCMESNEEEEEYCVSIDLSNSNSNNNSNENDTFSNNGLARKIPKDDSWHFIENEEKAQRKVDEYANFARTIDQKFSISSLGNLARALAKLNVKLHEHFGNRLYLGVNNSISTVINNAKREILLTMQGDKERMVTEHLFFKKQMYILHGVLGLGMLGLFATQMYILSQMNALLEKEE